MSTRPKAIGSIGLCVSRLSLLMDTALAQTAAIMVNTTADDINAGDGQCTLREAINNANTNRDTTNGDCQTGSAYPTIDAIAFNIQLAQPQPRIIPNSPLPTLTEAVVIDGTSQPGFQTLATHSLVCPNPMGVPLPPQTLTISRPVIELNGAAAGNGSGMTINANQVVIRGLVINQFQGSGINILNSSRQIIIDSNYIGTDSSGTVALGNNRGVVIEAGNTTNPHTILIKNNVISGNQVLGILVNGEANADQQGNTIVNNFIGTDYRGKKVVGNTTEQRGYGIVIGQGNFAALESRYPAENHTIRGNVIAGSHTANLWISNYASKNLIECNYIGTDQTGTVALGNCVDGLLIGGTRTDAPSRLNQVRYNLISGNAQCQGNSEANLTLQWGAIENTIEYNLIGTDITGTMALSPILSTDGIGIKKPANQIHHNVIGGHRRHGIHIYRGFGKPPWDNRIENNYIGINPSGINIANGGDGIAIFSNIYTPDQILPLMDVSIRGTRIIGNAIANNGYNGIRLEARGDEAGFKASLTNTQILNNTIHNNGANGIQIITRETVPGGMAQAINNLIQMNSLFNNHELGIRLSPSHSTSHDVFMNGETGRRLAASVPSDNDAFDLDSGSNQLQNYPILFSAEGNNNTTEIQGILISTPHTQFTLEFFANSRADPSDYGEGEVPLGSVSVTTNHQGEATFSAVLPATVAGQSITATATDSSGNTSEFSRHVPVKLTYEQN